MKNDQNRDTLVGGLIVLVVAGLFGFSYLGKDAAAEASATSYPLTAVFSRVDGLFTGNEVRLAGIRVGEVGEQILDANFRVVVRLKIDNGVEIPVDSSVAIHTDGLFGSKFVVLEPGGEDAMLTSGGEIEYTQGAMVVSELLSLIIDEGKAKQAKSTKTKDSLTQQGGN